MKIIFCRWLAIIAFLLVYVHTINPQGTISKEYKYYWQAKEMEQSIEQAYIDNDYEKADSLLVQLNNILLKADIYSDIIILKYKAASSMSKAKDSMNNNIAKSEIPVLVNELNSIIDKFKEGQYLEKQAWELSEQESFNDSITQYNNSITLYKNVSERALILKDQYAAVHELKTGILSWKAKAEKQIGLLQGTGTNLTGELKEKQDNALNLFQEANNQFESLPDANDIQTLIMNHETVLKNYTDAAVLASGVVDLVFNNNKKDDAQKQFQYAGKRLAESKALMDELGLDDKYKECQDNLLSAKEFYDKAEYNNSMDLSEKTIAILDELNIGTIYPRYYRVRLIPDDNDTLWKISAYKWVYNDPLFWPNIFAANEEKFEGRSFNLIYPGELFVIPSIGDEKRYGEYNPDDPSQIVEVKIENKKNALKNMNGVVKAVDLNNKSVSIEAGGQTLLFKTDSETCLKINSFTGKVLNFYYIEMKSGVLYMLLS